MGARRGGSRCERTTTMSDALNFREAVAAGRLWKIEGTSQTFVASATDPLHSFEMALRWTPLAPGTPVEAVLAQPGSRIGCMIYREDGPRLRAVKRPVLVFDGQNCGCGAW